MSPSPKIHLLVDVEALGPPGSGEVVAVGIVPIISTAPAFTVNISIPPSPRLEASTLRWWMEQTAEVREQLTGGIPKPLAAASLEAYLRRFEPKIYLWSTAWEDFAWLDQFLAPLSSLRALGIRTNDAGTIFRMSGIRPPENWPRKHVALDDALVEASVLVKAAEALGMDWDAYGELK